MKLEIHVICKAKRTEIIEEREGFLKIRLHAIPEKGKANEALIAFLSEHFQIPKSSIKLVRGHSSTRKIVEF